MTNSRAGFSLMEVMVASTIFMGSLIILDELANMGTRNAIDVETYITAQNLCEQQLNRILTGIDSMQEAENETFDDYEDWSYTVEIEPLDTPGLTSVKVIVQQDEEKFLRPKSYELVRWVASPDSNNQESGSEYEPGNSTLFDDL